MGVPRNFKIEPPYDPAILLLGIYPKEVRAGSQEDICTPMFIAAFIIHGREKAEATQVSIDGKMDEQGVVCMYLKGKEILTQATTWMNLEDMMLNEISQTQKDKYCLIPLP